MNGLIQLRGEYQQRSSAHLTYEVQSSGQVFIYQTEISPNGLEYSSGMYIHQAAILEMAAGITAKEEAGDVDNTEVRIRRVDHFLTGP